MKTPPTRTATACLARFGGIPGWDHSTGGAHNQGMLGFLLRFLALEVVTAAGALLSSQIVSASPHWGHSDGGREVRFAVFIAVVGIPGNVLLAVATRGPADVTCAALAVVGVLCTCGVLAGSTSSSTAGLIYLWFPLVGIVGGIVAVMLRAWSERSLP